MGQIPISLLSGVGPKTEKKLHAMNLFTVRDFLFNYPRSYVNKGKIIKIGEITDGEHATIKARIVDCKSSVGKFRKTMMKVRVTDGFGYLSLVFFNAPYLNSKFKTGEWFYFFGQIKKDGLLPVMFHPEFYPTTESEEVCELGISPIYSLAQGITQNDMNKWSKLALERLSECVYETLPETFRKRHKLCDLPYAISQIHFPEHKKAYQMSKNKRIFKKIVKLACVKHTLSVHSESG